MNLRTTRRITYTTPPTAADATSLDEIGAIDAKPKPSKADKERRTALVAELGAVTQVRATVATMSALAQHRYSGYRRLLYEWIEAETGQKFGDAIETPEWIALVRLASKWAATLGSLTRLESRQIGPMDDDAAAAWQEIDLPDEWKAPATYLDTIPPDFMDELERAALDVNPSLYGPPPVTVADGDVKKRGGVSVS